MVIKDIFGVTGGSTKIKIYSIEGENKYKLFSDWSGIVDDINFEHVPYGDYKVEHITVVNGEDILQLYFKYPQLSKKEIEDIDIIAGNSKYSKEDVESLYVKYKDLDFIREFLHTGEITDEAVGQLVSLSFIEKLYQKYKNWEHVREVLLTKDIQSIGQMLMQS